ncbi:hypothetical protein M5D96_012230, partial [Drosophila gunungcola]
SCGFVMRALCAMMRHTSRVVVCGRTGSVLVCSDPLHSSGMITRSTLEQAGRQLERHWKRKHKNAHLWLLLTSNDPVPLSPSDAMKVLSTWTALQRAVR